MTLRAGKTRAETCICNIIEYNVKSSQFKLTIKKRTKTQVKGLTINPSQENRWHGQRVYDEIEQNYKKSDH